MILVALMLLVFLTLVATGMSRNSFREILSSGTTRQGTMARNAADSGIEWAIYWLYAGNTPDASNASAQQLAGPNGLVNALLTNPNLSGQYVNLYFGSATSPSMYTNPAGQSLQSDMSTGTAGGTTQGFTIALMRMGQLPVTGMSQGTSSGTFRPAMGGENQFAPDLWAVRSDGQVTYGGVTFRQSREAWISTPTR